MIHFRKSKEGTSFLFDNSNLIVVVLYKRSDSQADIVVGFQSRAPSHAKQLLGHVHDDVIRNQPMV